MQIRCLTMLPLFVLVTACYRTTPITGATPAAGTEVVVDLTDRGAVELAPTLGERLESVRGLFDMATDDRLALLMLGATDRTGAEAPWRRERVEIPRDYVASVSRRQFDRMRSVLATTLLLTGVVIAGGIASGGSGIGGFFGGGGGQKQ